MFQQSAYRKIAGEITLPLFAQPWWLDAVTDGQWNAVLAHDDKGKLTGSWAFGLKQMAGMKRIFMPPFTPYLGPVLHYEGELSEYEFISLQNKVFKMLLDELPEVADIRFKCQPGMNNWLPFYWRGFEQTTRYTYIIDDTADIEEVYEGFKDSLKRQIKKADKQLKVNSVNDITSTIALFKKSLIKSGSKLEWSDSLFSKIDQTASAHQCRAILEARDESGDLYASIYLVWDNNTMYYLFGGMDEAYGDSGAKSLLFWKAINMASEKNLTFNFEGSMIPGVERFFRSFGGELTPVYYIYKRKFPFNMIPI
jgi:lipid II:glycine glycyltransferase (peptidoglycan interpeptide bridge formation enzyme)